MRRPQITTQRFAEIFGEMVSSRRLFAEDWEFFKMTRVLELLFEEDEGNEWKLKTFRSLDAEPRGAVVALDGKVTLTVDERLLERAEKGQTLANFILAHEIAGHIGLDHHATGALTKHFKLIDGPKGKSNIPKNVEELEADYAGVIFQCGVALMDSTMDPVRLAHLAYSDVSTVKLVQKLVQLEVFKAELARQTKPRERVVL